MAARTWQMTIIARQLWNRSIPFAAMTKKARQSGMVPTAVLKLRVVKAFGHLHRLLIRAGDF
jgi:hypothetical protein